MSALPTQDQLTRALSDAGRAHHDYETGYLAGVRDEEWAGWYAAYVLGRLGDFHSATALTGLLKDAPADGNWARAASVFVLSRIREA